MKVGEGGGGGGREKGHGQLLHKYNKNKKLNVINIVFELDYINSLTSSSLSSFLQNQNNTV